MARITRKELKTDKFALEVSQTVDFFEQHRREVLRYGAVVLVVVVAVAALYFYRRHQQTLRAEELSHAIRVYQAPVGQANTGGGTNFPTQEAKDAEARKLFSTLAANHPGTDEGQIAQYYLGSMAVDQGNFSEAEKHLQDAARSGDEKYASLAKLQLGQVYFAAGKPGEGEKVLRSLIENPTMFVTKEQATITLARNLAASKPAEARKLLEPLRTQSGQVSQIAMQLYSEIPGQ